MNWFGKYVIEPNGFIHWREGMLVHDQALVEALERPSIIGYMVGMCSEFGVVIGKA